MQAATQSILNAVCLAPPCNWGNDFGNEMVCRVPSIQNWT
jgi:hypothetical protein